MSKKFFSAVLAAGLFSAAVAVQAATIEFSSENTGFYFDDVTDTWTGSFVVNNGLDDSGVVLFTTSALTSFDPFLVVWDSSGRKIGYNNDKSSSDWDAQIDLGQLADGRYSFTIGNWPNGPAGEYFSDGFTGALGHGLFPNRGHGEWNVFIQGVSAVPEPETWAMLLAGLGIMGAVTRRQRTKATS
ncbi:MAG: DVUA0089 family protein [Azoarcus sp.]|jgi:hypothetical protein|nr:DVUA0089 family protein [Azoarcus sp.]